MEVNETRMSGYWYSSKYQKNRMNGFENGKTQLFNSGGVVKWEYFQKKVEYPFNVWSVDISHTSK